MDRFLIFVFTLEDLSRRVCRYFRTRSGCWRGDQCPNLHVKKGSQATETTILLLQFTVKSV